MKPTSPNPNQWAAIDLHVHTPASKDYQGPRDDSEFLSLLRRANEFEKSATPRLPKKTKASSINCVAFTDHNSVDGFTTWKSIYDKSADLAEAVRERDPNNPLLKQLKDDLDLLKSIRVLMGVEIKAYPGVHLLVIWHEAVQPQAAQEFIGDAYSKDYKALNGDPEPTTTWPIEQVLDKIEATFGSHALVIAPHIETGGGLYECLKELAPVRMAVLRHPALRALSFNKVETRERIRNLLKHPEYERSVPLAFVQSSDSHGSRGAIGYPRTEVHVPNGRSTFTAIRDAFAHGIRVKCSVDLLDEEYRALTEGEPVAHFSSVGTSGFAAPDHQRFSDFACAALNCDRGIIELESTGIEDKETSTYPDIIRHEFERLLDSLVEPKALGVFYSLV